MLVLSRKVGEEIVIGRKVIVRVAASVPQPGFPDH